MLQMAVGKMILVLHLVILVYVLRKAAGFTTNECEKIGDVYQKLDVAEQLIKSAREEFSNLQASFPKDCQDLFDNGEKKSGVYLVWPINRIISGSIRVYCDMRTDGGGWTVIQRRGNFSRPKDYFNQDWKAYKEGFGNIEEDFWLGNDKIYALSNQKPYSVRFDLGDVEGNKRYAVYDTFWIDDENSNYTLHVSGYSGDAEDSFSYHSGCMFSTNDRENDRDSERHCARIFAGGWWYNACFSSYLNGGYIPGKLEKEKFGKGLHWSRWTSGNVSLATSEIKIRKMPFWVQ